VRRDGTRIGLAGPGRELPPHPAEAPNRLLRPETRQAASNSHPEPPRKADRRFRVRIARRRYCASSARQASFMLRTARSLTSSGR
jgi:hypothetical protein